MNLIFYKQLTHPLIFIFVLFISLSCDSNKSADDQEDPIPVLENWTLVWNDEFDGRTLNPEKWTPQIGDGCDIGICGWGNQELQWYLAENAAVASGVLVISVTRQSVGSKEYTSARLRTKGKGDWRYGRFDIRAKLPQTQSLWPAIWMLPTDNVYGGWAGSGEIDIMELKGHKPQEIHGTLHYGGSWPANTFTGIEYTLPKGTFADDFHVFTLEWEPGEFRWFVDDVLWQTQTDWYTNGHSFPAPFDQQFHLLLNVAVGGNFPGNPDETTVFPQRMEVDYVRVYEAQLPR